MKKLTHTDYSGKAIMVDIGEKEIQTRIAKAEGHITLALETIKLIKANQLKKGDVLTVAQIAGINAAKQTQLLIPLCHNITIDKISIDLFVNRTGVTVKSEVRCKGKTGVEMEALTAVSIALLTVYDMCKAVDKNMMIDKIVLIEKIKK
ncbi:MAG: cyclic pyranopterin monophosphate synthase MoaC [Bacteroidia bacterium]|jgi:cyclic pyranopterin phosphate synthase|nr:cyclic pyranopterin monophosphate synthase MoaC [Bacteroidia bacterium]